MSKIGKKAGRKAKRQNRKLIKEQKKQAARVEQKENERQSRLQVGRDLVNTVFEGGRVPGGAGLSARQLAQSRIGDRFKGIGQDFYDNYRKSLEDFYMPELERQYEDTRSQNLFDLGRRGLLRSSESADRNAKIARARAENEASARSDIEGQVTGLQGDVQNAKTRAMNMLATTEDPTTAANQALTEVNAITGRSPQFSTLGNLFGDLADAYGSFQQVQSMRNAARSIPVRGPRQSSGRVYG